MWVRDNEPGVYAKTYKALNAKDFIVLRLTGKFYTEPSDATSNACIDLNTLQWSEKIVNASGIDGNKLPEIVPSTTVAGEVTPWAAGQTGLKAGTPVVMGGGDGLCSNVGAGSITCNYNGVHKHKTVIGKDAFIGSDTMMVAPAQIGDGALVAAGSVITEPVPADALGLGRARQVNIEGWAADYRRRLHEDDEV